jgi:hypothetical protein
MVSIDSYRVTTAFTHERYLDVGASFWSNALPFESRVIKDCHLSIYGIMVHMIRKRILGNKQLGDLANFGL